VVDQKIPARATRREWLALAAIALPCMVYAMDLTVLNLALPAISADLKPSASQLLWIVDIYGFMVAGFLITMGTLGDKIGRRRLLMIGSAAFAVASGAAAMASSVESLIVLRAVLGIAGATLAPSTLSLMSNIFHDERERRVAIGIWISSYSVGAVIGPLVGGAILHYFSWPAIFLVAVPVMLLLLAVGPVLLPEYRDPKAGNLDLRSVGLSLFAVLGLVYALKQFAEGNAAWHTWLAAAAAAASALAFARRQGVVAYPLLDLQLFKQKKFAAAISTYALTSFAMFGVYIFSSQYLQLVLGFTPLIAGLCTVPWAASFVLGSMITPWLAQRASATRVITYGLLVATAGFAALAMIDGRYGLAWLIGGMIVMGIGMAPVFTLGNDIVLSTAPRERAGAASAISETSSELSGAMGIAVFGSLATVLYRDAFMSSAAGLPAATVAAASTLGGAHAAANALGAPQGEALRTLASAAFVDSMQVAAVFASLIMLMSAVVVVGILGNGRNRPADVAVQSESS
jgi:DHA2 family multidrug resistance protein-like MFS transporter